MFERQIRVGWSDLDANSHMRNTAYLDRAADTRMIFFAEHGFPIAEFARLGVGPVIRRDTVDYFRECHLLDTLRVTLAFSGMSPDAARFAIVNEFWRGDRLVARVTSAGGWLDRAARALTVPPDVLAVVLRAAPRAEGFEALSNLEPRP